jgi:hypothetical protein
LWESLEGLSYFIFEVKRPAVASRTLFSTRVVFGRSLTGGNPPDKIGLSAAANFIMNEPPNPAGPNVPPSDSTPPPPPPFTPPPPPAEPAPPPAAAAPQQPVYVPSAAPPAKKSSMPWILGGCGCLILILIVAAIIGFSVYRASQKVSDFKNDFKSALKSVDDKSSPSSRSRAGWNTYSNVKENLPAGLQPNFVAFSFDYPKSFTIQPQGEVNFVKVEKYAPGGKGNTAENFAVGYAWFTPPTAQSDELYDKLLDDLGQQLSRTFHNYKELKRTPETVDGVKSRAALFQADFNDPSKTMIWGRTIVVHPPGKKNGVSILILGTSLGRDIKSADDLGVKGESAEILRSFRFQ